MTEIIIADMTADELLISIQPDDESRKEALLWIAKNKTTTKSKSEHITTRSKGVVQK